MTREVRCDGSKMPTSTCEATGLRGDWPTVRGPLATGRAPPAERWVLAGLRVAFEGGTWLIEFGTSKGVIQADFTNAATPLDVQAQTVGRDTTANLGSGLCFP